MKKLQTQELKILLAQHKNANTVERKLNTGDRLISYLAGCLDGSPDLQGQLPVQLGPNQEIA